MNKLSDRPYDVVVWGATGFTGRRVAAYLARHAPSRKRLAIAGRNQAKLEQIRDELGHPELAILVGESGDRPSLDEIAKKTRVVCATAGPFARLGAEMVGACAEHGTSYCDLTGEPHFVARMIEAHHERATQTGARLVHCCGFDSIPSDLGTWMVQDHARKLHGLPCSEVKFRIEEADMDLSGGTLASLANVAVEATSDASVRRVLTDSHSLCPRGQGRREAPNTAVIGPGRDPDFGWVAPFIMAAINERIVRRSNALLDDAYGANFAYSEGMLCDSWFGAAGRSAASARLMVAALPGVRTLFGTRSAGEGPSERSLQEGSFTAHFLGKGATSSGEPFEIRGTVGADREPGYEATSWMIAHSALCLAHDDIGVGGGSWTPASGMGAPLMQRLRSAGMTFRIDA